MSDSSKYGKGKAKGGAFEREIAVKLSLWYSEGERDDIFYRSHSSGARFTSRKKRNKDTAYQSGDITCSDPAGKILIDNWSIECKTGYGKWDILDSIDSKQPKSAIENFWNQCLKDAKLSCKNPVLIFRRQSRFPCICMDSKYFCSLEWYFGDCKDKQIKISLPEGRKAIVIMKLDDFFKWIPNFRGFYK